MLLLYILLLLWVSSPVYGCAVLVHVSLFPGACADATLTRQRVRRQLGVKR